MAQTDEAAAKRTRIEDEDLVAVARVVKTRGVRGETVAELLTDFPERFDALKSLIAVEKSGARFEIEIESFRFHDRRIVFKFKNYDAPETARALIGCELCVLESECVALEPDEFYDWQLIGCRVETIDGAEIGTVRDILKTGAAPILIIERMGRETLVPFAEKICVEIDIRRKLIRVDAPEGLLDS
jgi:16S rRNA processing protein RimM